MRWALPLLASAVATADAASPAARWSVEALAGVALADEGSEEEEDGDGGLGFGGALRPFLRIGGLPPGKDMWKQKTLGGLPWDIVIDARGAVAWPKYASRRGGVGPLGLWSIGPAVRYVFLEVGGSLAGMWRTVADGPRERRFSAVGGAVRFDLILSSDSGGHARRLHWVFPLASLAIVIVPGGGTAWWFLTPGVRW